MGNLDNSFIYVKTYETSLGMLDIGVRDGAIVNISLHEKGVPAFADVTPLSEKANEEIQEYLSKKRKTFDLPLSYPGSAFCSKVYDELLKVPYGKTITYHELAKRSGRPLGSRAVGKVLHNNPILIIIPCHRVLGHNHELVGFSAGLKMKKALLELEEGSSI